MEYKLLMARPDQLQNDITEHLADGWELYGTIIVQPMQSILIQPVIRKTPTKTVKKKAPYGTA